MKICLLLQRRFVYVGHQIAVNLKEKHGVTDFCAYVQVREGYEYLKNQKDINYSSLLLDEEIQKRYKDEELDIEFLKQLEKDYGIPNLWPYVDLDRIIRFNQLIREYPYDTPKYSHEDMMKMVQVYAKEIIAMLDREKPDVVFTAIFGSLGSYLLYEIAKKKGIRTVLASITRIGSRYTLSDDHSYLTKVDEAFEALQQNGSKSSKYDEAKKFVDEFLEKPKSYHYQVDKIRSRANRLAQMSFLKPASISRYVRWLAKAVSRDVSSASKDDYSFQRPWGKIIDQFKRKARNLIGVSDLYDEIDTSEDFAFYPLHMEPEISTMLYAPFFMDQLWLIKQIAKSLPLHYKLYVKEQPAMVDLRPRSFYKELKKIPNVKLVNPKVSSFEITPHAKLITTITGTVGWEALFFGKPVITFGNVFYNHFPSVKQCKTPEKLPYLIKQQLEEFSYDKELFINFVGCLIEQSVDVNLQYLWEKETDMDKKKSGVAPLADFLYQEISKTS